MIVDFIASLSFYLIPYLTGRFFSKRIISAWIIGALLWFALFFILSPVSSLTHTDFSQTVRGLAIVISLISLFYLAKDWFSGKFAFDLEDKWILVPLVIFSSFVYLLIWVRNTPYPLSMNWDIHEHMTLSNLISSGKISFLTSKMSDTFSVNSYPPLFHVLLSIPTIIFQKSTLGIYWFLNFWHYLLTIIASFLLAKKLSNNNLTALLSGVISALVFESVVVYSSLFLIPQTLTALLTIFVFIDLGKEKLKFSMLSLLGIFLMHYIVGFLCGLVLAGTFLVNRYRISTKLINISIFVSILLSAGLVLLNNLGKWQLISGEEASHFNFGLLQKLGFFADWYGLGLILAFLLGGYLAIKKDNLNQKLALIFAILILGITFAPFSYFLKFYVLGRYFVNFTLALGFTFLLSGLPKTAKYLGFAIILFSLVAVFYKNQLAYKNPLQFKSLETQISNEEISAAKFLLIDKTEGSFLISDPATQYILEALSGVNTQGGVYMNQDSRNILSSLDRPDNSYFLESQLLKIRDELSGSSVGKVYFVIGGRYFAWQKLTAKEKQSSFYNIWSPKEISTSDKAYIDSIIRSPYFKLDYKNDELAIFEVR